MKITTCPTCKGTGRKVDGGCPAVCSDCLGTGEVNVRPAVRSLNLTDALVDSLAEDMDPMEAG